MRFTPHSEIEGQHAILSPSNHHWVNDEPEKLLTRVANRRMAALGTRKHEAAKMCIELGIKLENNGLTVNRYVNDCIGYRMKPEVPLFVSWNAFGTVDAISFRREDEDQMVLRIFDLKTGVTDTSFRQLKLYAAFFCIEYKIRPMEIGYDLRIYQNDAIKMCEIDPEEIVYLIDRTLESDKLINKALSEEVI